MGAEGLISLMMSNVCAKADSPVDVASGLYGLVMSVVTIVGALHLMKFASLINRVLHDKTEPRLGAALESLRLFWVYTGIVLIVIVALLAILLLLAVSAAGGIPSGWP